MTLTIDETVFSSFQQRLDHAREHPEDFGCAHALFPEITESAPITGAITSTMDALEELLYSSGGDLQVMAGGVEHAMVTVAALALALGAAHAVADVDTEIPDNVSDLFAPDGPPESA